MIEGEGSVMTCNTCSNNAELWFYIFADTSDARFTFETDKTTRDDETSQER